jgi:hypothetical protein
VAEFAQNAPKLHIAPPHLSVLIQEKKHFLYGRKVEYGIEILWSVSQKKKRYLIKELVIAYQPTQYSRIFANALEMFPDKFEIVYTSHFLWPCSL